MADKITALTEQDKQHLLNKSAKVLPDNPTDKGFNADQIKKSMYEPSAILFNYLQRLAEETAAFGDDYDSELGKIKDGTTVVKKAEQDESGNNIKSTYFAGVTEINGAHSATYQKRYYRFTNKNGNQAGILVVNLDLATTEYAGLLSASDKGKINNISSDVATALETAKAYTDEKTARSYLVSTLGEATTSSSGLLSATDKGKIDVSTSKTYVDAFVKSASLLIDSSTYVVTLKLKDANGTVISTQTIDLPLESVVVSGSYNNLTKKVVLTLQSGSTIEFSVADLVAGLVSQTSSASKVYGTDSDGEQTLFSVDDYPGADGNIVRRDESTSQIIVPLTPTANGHASSKQYVDSKVAKTTTIAGVDLQDSITSQELTDALVFMNSTTDLDYVMGE